MCEKQVVFCVPILLMEIQSTGHNQGKSPTGFILSYLHIVRGHCFYVGPPVVVVGSKVLTETANSIKGKHTDHSKVKIQLLCTKCT